MLLKGNADVDSRDGMGCTPLRLSALSGQKRVTTLQLERGANDNDGVVMLE